MFRFKQFVIDDSGSEMKIGTDGVLLGAWANALQPENILDIGTGCGLIALMLAQRFEAMVTGVEIESLAALQAIKNMDNSPWGNRIQIVNQSFQNFLEASDSCFDLIVCNPPFFSNSLKSNNSSRNLARHNDSLPASILLSGVSKLLSPDGIAAFILPFSDQEGFLQEVFLNKLYPARICEVSNSPNHPPKRILLEISKKEPVCCEKETLCIRNQENKYSIEYQNLTNEFHPDF